MTSLVYSSKRREGGNIEKSALLVLIDIYIDSGVLCEYLKRYHIDVCLLLIYMKRKVYDFHLFSPHVHIVFGTLFIV